MVKRVIFTTWGTLGDLHPYIAVAIELKRRGYNPVIATSELYRSNVEAEGIEFYSVRPNASFLRGGQNNEQNKDIISQAMDSKEGTRYLICNLLLPHLRDSYEDLIKAVAGADLLVTHHLTFAGPLVAETTGISWISTILSPILIVSAYDSLVLSKQNQLDLFNPLINGGLVWLGKNAARAWSEPVRQLRSELGLPQGEDPLFEGKYSSDLVLAMFSQVFAKHQPDWPKQTYITGFTFYDNEVKLSPGLSQFLDNGPPPIVFTLGSSAVQVAGDFYIESAIAAKELGFRAILLIGNTKDLPQNLLSENIATFDYAPYSEIFPRACAIVHQGGIGTIAQALRAGRPMLIVPHSHDQPYNAARTERLGIARIVTRNNYTSGRVVAELKQLLEDRRYSVRAAEVGQQIRAEDGVRTVCDQIEAHLNKLRST